MSIWTWASKISRISTPVSKKNTALRLQSLTIKKEKMNIEKKIRDADDRLAIRSLVDGYPFY